MEYGSYEYALNHRCNWVNPHGGGEVTYIGRYCVITGLMPEDDDYITYMYNVGEGAVMDSTRSAIAILTATDCVSAILNHDEFVIQADRMDSLEFVYEW